MTFSLTYSRDFLIASSVWNASISLAKYQRTSTNSQLASLSNSPFPMDETSTCRLNPLQVVREPNDIQQLRPLLPRGTHIVSEIQLQQCIHALYLSVGLGTQAGEEVKIRPDQLKELGAKPYHELRIAIARDQLRHTPILHDMLHLEPGASSTGQLYVDRKNVAGPLSG
ncbi:hypothetical protein CRG98_005866 [Punica granatum]|uniref:Uncharacterized protein n=1 Tax=Punica granatum TaxID=22663 RepID=A0A2I0KZ39_PUNGR|nr:hypothetical protein CRG98_005866 [Punica granatum]